MGVEPNVDFDSALPQDQFVDSELTSFSRVLIKGAALKCDISIPTIVGYNPYLVDEDSINKTFKRQTDGLLTSYCPVNESNITTDVNYVICYYPIEVGYRVQYYVENINCDSFVLTESLTKVKQEYVGYKILEDDVKLTSADEEDLGSELGGFELYYYDKDREVAADGSTIVSVYYKRLYFTLKFNLKGGYGRSLVYKPYSSPVSVVPPSRVGYEFSGWNKVKEDNKSVSESNVTLPTAMPCHNISYEAIWTPVEVGFHVTYYIENPDYDFLVSRYGASSDEVTNIDEYEIYRSFEVQKGWFNGTDGTSTKIGSTVSLSVIDTYLQGTEYVAKVSEAKDAFEKFNYYSYSEEKTKLANNTTTDNVTLGSYNDSISIYYDRKEFTYHFYFAKKTGSTYYYLDRKGTGCYKIADVVNDIHVYNYKKEGDSSIKEWSLTGVSNDDSLKNTLFSTDYNDTDNGNYFREKVETHEYGGSTYYYLNLTYKYMQTLYKADKYNIWPSEPFKKLSSYTYKTFVSWVTDINSRYAYLNSSNINIKGLFTVFDETTMMFDYYTGDKTGKKLLTDDNGTPKTHELVAYWGNPNTYKCHIFVSLTPEEASADNVKNHIFTDYFPVGQETNLTGITGTNAEKTESIMEGTESVNYRKFHGTIYRELSVTTALSTDIIPNISTPTFEGLKSVTYNDVGITQKQIDSKYPTDVNGSVRSSDSSWSSSGDADIFFYYTREKYKIQLYNYGDAVSGVTCVYGDGTKHNADEGTVGNEFTLVYGQGMPTFSNLDEDQCPEVLGSTGYYPEDWSVGRYTSNRYYKTSYSTMPAQNLQLATDWVPKLYTITYVEDYDTYKTFSASEEYKNYMDYIKENVTYKLKNYETNGVLSDDDYDYNKTTSTANKYKYSDIIEKATNTLDTYIKDKKLTDVFEVAVYQVADGNHEIAKPDEPTTTDTDFQFDNWYNYDSDEKITVLYGYAAMVYIDDVLAFAGWKSTTLCPYKVVYVDDRGYDEDTGTYNEDYVIHEPTYGYGIYGYNLTINAISITERTENSKKFWPETSKQFYIPWHRTTTLMMQKEKSLEFSDVERNIFVIPYKLVDQVLYEVHYQDNATKKDIATATANTVVIQSSNIIVTERCKSIPGWVPLKLWQTMALSYLDDDVIILPKGTKVDGLAEPLASDTPVNYMYFYYESNSDVITYSINHYYEQLEVPSGSMTSNYDPGYESELANCVLSDEYEYGTLNKYTANTVLGGTLVASQEKVGYKVKTYVHLTVTKSDGTDGATKTKYTWLSLKNAKSVVDKGTIVDTTSSYNASTDYNDFKIDENTLSVGFDFYYMLMGQYSYTVKYLDVTTGKSVEYEDENGVTQTASDKVSAATYKYGETVTATPITINGYTSLMGTTGESLVITDDNDKNVIMFYYKKTEDITVTINYHLVAPDSTSSDLKLVSTSEILSEDNTTVQGSQINADALDHSLYHFKGWYTNENCTKEVTSTDATVDDTKLTITPNIDITSTNVMDEIYDFYALYNASFKITKTIDKAVDAQKFLFKVELYKTKADLLSDSVSPVLSFVTSVVCDTVDGDNKTGYTLVSPDYIPGGAWQWCKIYELDEWSSTNYDQGDCSITHVGDTDTYITKNDTNSRYVAFDYSAIYNATPTSTSDITEANFKNTIDEYAYLSPQAYADNEISK